MAIDLIVYSPVHFLETSLIVLDDKTHDLVVADSEITVQDFMTFMPPGTQLRLGTVLFPDDSWHDHVATIVVLDVFVHNLKVDDCYHVLIDEGHTYRVQPHFRGNLGDGLEPNYLPWLRLEASCGHRGDVDADLPDLRSEGYSGAYLDAKLSHLESEGQISRIGAANLSSLLPTLQIDARSGLRFAGKLPYLEIDATVTGGLIGRLARNLPGIRCEASIADQNLASLDRDLPPLEIEATLTHQGSATLDRKLPTLKIVAIQYGGHATLDEKLPALLIEDSEGIVDGHATLDQELPTLVIRPIGTGIDSGGQADPAYLQYEERFEDYILRYAR
jgi:hypothetical protein